MDRIEHTATWPRRMLALAIDWLACSLIALLIVGRDNYPGDTFNFTVLGLYWLEASLGTALAGGSFGQLATRIRVLAVNGGPLPLIPSVIRTFLICLVIPPLVFRPDGRGLHDVAARSAAYDLTALRGR